MSEVLITFLFQATISAVNFSLIFYLTQETRGNWRLSGVIIKTTNNRIVVYLKKKKVF